MDFSDEKQIMAQIGFFYYMRGATMEQLAKRFGISRFRISRLLKQARDEGIIEIQIAVPLVNEIQYEERLENALGLNRAIVVQQNENSTKEQCLETIGLACAKWLKRTMADGDILGVSWGRTLKKVVDALSFDITSETDITVVQLMGGMSQRLAPYNADQICKGVADAFGHVDCHLLFAPAIVNDEAARQVIMSQANIKRTCAFYDKINVALCGIGTLIPIKDNIQYQLGYLSNQDVQNLKDEEAVGDNLVFYDVNGKICGQQLDSKRIGISQEQFKKVDRRIGIAIGENKINAIIGAARAGLTNELITDVDTAVKILKIVE